MDLDEYKKVACCEQDSLISPMLVTDQEESKEPLDEDAEK